MLNAYEFLPETLRRLVTRGIVPGVNEKAPQEFAVVHLPIPIANDNPPWSQHSTPWRILVFSTDTLCAREIEDDVDVRDGDSETMQPATKFDVLSVREILPIA